MKQENMLDKIDQYFEKQPNTNMFYLSIMLCVVVFGYLIYDYAYESSEEYYYEEKELLSKSEKELMELEEFLLNERNNSTIERYKNDLLNIKKDMKIVDEDNNYIKHKLEVASKLLYNQKNWSGFISRINALAKKYGVELNDVKSHVNNLSNGDVKEAFNVTFSINGSFQNILHFINQLERSVEVVDVSTLKFFRPLNENSKLDKISSSSKPYGIQADIDISIWGIKY